MAQQISCLAFWTARSITLNLRRFTSAMRTVGFETISNSGTRTRSPNTRDSIAVPFEETTTAATSISRSYVGIAPCDTLGAFVNIQSSVYDKSFLLISTCFYVGQTISLSSFISEDIWHSVVEESRSNLYFIQSTKYFSTNLLVLIVFSLFMDR